MWPTRGASAAGRAIARVRWTDEGNLTYGILDSTNQFVERLVEYWSELYGIDPPR